MNFINSAIRNATGAKASVWVLAIAAIRDAVGGEFGGEFGSQLPALLITGDTAPERLSEAQETGVMLLHKPVAPNELYRAIAQVLD